MSRSRHQRHSTGDLMGYSDTYYRFEARGLKCPHHLKFRWRHRKTRPYGLKLFTGYGGETYSSRFRMEYWEPVIDKGSERARIRTELKNFSYEESIPRDGLTDDKSHC